jgi:hypothetical protein
MTHKPVLDIEVHEGDTAVSVWKRRAILALLIILVVAISAPVFSGCGGALARKKVVATYEVAGRTHDVTDEELGGFMTRFNAMERLLSPDPRQSRGLADGEEGQKQALTMLVFDAAAKAEGVDVPDTIVSSTIQNIPLFQVAGAFDGGRYRSVLSEYGRGILTPESFEDTLRMQFRVMEYQQIYGAAFEILPGDEAYEAWRKRNIKLTAAYVTSSFEAQRAKFADAHPTPEDYEAMKKLPAVQAILARPPAKTIEVAYVKASDMTADQFEAAKKFCTDAEIFTDDSPLVDEAKKLFHFDRELVFTKDRWVSLFHPEYAEEKKTAQKAHDEWAALPKEEQEKRKEPLLPADPGASYPAEERAQFLLWMERTEKEVLAREIVRKFGADAQRAGKSFAELAPQFAKYGLKTAKNPEPLPDKELIEKFPDPVARNSEFDQVAFGRFRPVPEGQVFKPVYNVEPPVPTTRLPEKMEDRGFMVMRLESCDPARQYDVSEKVNEVLEFWRKYKTAEGAKLALEEVRKKAEAAGPDAAKVAEAMTKAAAEAGLPSDTLNRFNRKTESPKPPTAAPGQALSPELAAVARNVAVKNRVQQSYQPLSQLAPGKFLDVIVDEKIEAAVLVLLVDKQDPAPLEMQEAELRQERIALYSQGRQKMNDLVGFDALAKRFDIRLFLDDKKNKNAEVKPAGEPSKKQ